MKVIITGASGMVGKSVLLECLEHAKVKKILIINRNSINLEHPKLTEIILPDFNQVTTIKNNLKGYDACFYCMGVSAFGMNESNYTKITFNITKMFVDVLYELAPQMIFNYVSGTGTDSLEKTKIMWGRVKGKTENMIRNREFKDAYFFRPGFIIPDKGVKSKTPLYSFFYSLTKPFYPLFKKSPSVIGSSTIGKAMINSLLFPQALKHLENKDINLLAKKN